MTSENVLLKECTSTLKKPHIQKCYLCGEPCDEDDYCYGCRKYICSDCDENAVMGDHEPEDHKDVNGI